MMKRTILFLLCLLLAAGNLLGLTACGNKAEKEPFHFPYEDLPAVQESDAAYLLDPEFVVTEKNIFDCLCDYFAAPSILYYNTFVFSYHEMPFIKHKSVAEFAEVFRGVVWEPISLEEFRHASHIDFDFCNAIGTLQVLEFQGTTYISFSRRNDFVNDGILLRASCVDLLPALYQTALSLRDVSGRADPELENILERASNQTRYSDLPDILESDAAYLLDPNFTITEENLIDCINAYFTVPNTLDFGGLHKPTLEIKDVQRTKAFAEVVRSAVPMQIGKMAEFQDDDYQGSYWFSNAIGTLRFDSGKDATYVEFIRDNPFVYESYGDTATFCLEGNLFPAFVSIGETLESDATEPVLDLYMRSEKRNPKRYAPVEYDRLKVFLSDAFYLLDPEFTITEENLIDCIDDYLAAPVNLFYTFSPLSTGYERKFIQSKRAAEFSVVFQKLNGLTLTPVSEEQFLNRDTTKAPFTFQNAIGDLGLYEEDSITYLSFKLNNRSSTTDQIIFQVEETGMVKELNQIAVSLWDIEKDPAWDTEGE